MLIHAALIDITNIVVNRIALDTNSVYTPEAGLTLIPETPTTGISGRGWTWNGTSFVSPPPNVDPPPTAEQIRAGTFLAQADRADIIARLQTATPAQIDSWLLANVTNLAQARAVLGAIVKIFCVNPPT